MSVLKKHWRVGSADKLTQLDFQPIFDVATPPEGQDIDPNSKEVECRFVDMTIKAKDGKQMNVRMNYLDMFMFVYMCADEELRQQLQMRYERQAGQIPYEVTFSLNEDEKKTGIAKRLITLTVDEITMAIARSEARLLMGKSKPEFIEQYIARKTKKNPLDPGHYTNKK
jgi:hypothetical protein